MQRRPEITTTPHVGRECTVELCLVLIVFARPREVCARAAVRTDVLCARQVFGRVARRRVLRTRAHGLPSRLLGPSARPFLAAAMAVGLRRLPAAVSALASASFFISRQDAEDQPPSVCLLSYCYRVAPYGAV